MAKYTKRCSVKGESKVLASEACPAACGECEEETMDTDYGSNPCIDETLGYAPLRDDLADLPCMDADAQSATDVTAGAPGDMDPAIAPTMDYNDAGMCTVNVHWHIGAEHRSVGEYDEDCSYDHPMLEHYGDQSVYLSLIHISEPTRPY